MLLKLISNLKFSNFELIIMQKVIQQYQDVIIDPETQERLNKPLKDKTGLDEEYENFLHALIKKLEDGSINPHNAQTLYNRAVYDKLSEEDQEKADLTAINLISIIRQIEALWKAEHKTSFQIQNLVETVWQMKSKFEEQYGDVYII